HFVVHVRAGGAPGAAEEADLAVRRDALPDRHSLAMEMRIAGRDAIAVVDFDDLAVIVAITGIGHDARCRGVDRRHVGRPEIEPGMKRRAAIDRVATHPETAADLIAPKGRRDR